MRMIFVRVLEALLRRLMGSVTDRRLSALESSVALLRERVAVLGYDIPPGTLTYEEVLEAKRSLDSRYGDSATFVSRLADDVKQNRRQMRTDLRKGLDEGDDKVDRFRERLIADAAAKEAAAYVNGALDAVEAERGVRRPDGTIVKDKADTKRRDPRGPKR